jgi:hypothetical protein
MSKLYKVLDFNNIISMVDSNIIFIYLYEDWSNIKKFKQIIYTQRFHIFF